MVASSNIAMSTGKTPELHPGWSILTIPGRRAGNRLGSKFRTNATSRLPICVIVGTGPEGLSETEEVAMTFDLEEDFESERWRLLALVDCRKGLRDGSEVAIETDLEIVATRELIRTYETLKGYWSQKAFPQGPLIVATPELSRPSPRSGSARTSAKEH
jgi:hypothetical protein